MFFCLFVDSLVCNNHFSVCIPASFYSTRFIFLMFIQFLAARWGTYLKGRRVPGCTPSLLLCLIMSTTTQPSTTGWEKTESLVLSFTFCSRFGFSLGLLCEKHYTNCILLVFFPIASKMHLVLNCITDQYYYQQCQL